MCTDRRSEENSSVIAPFRSAGLYCICGSAARARPAPTDPQTTDDPLHLASPP